MRSHLIQLDIRWEDKGANYAAATALIERARPAAGDLIVLPEMFDTGFSMNAAASGDGDGATLGFLAGLAKRFKVFVQGGRTVAGRAGGKARNCAPALAPDGRVLVEYSKIHPFSLGREHEVFEGGTEVMTYEWGDTAGSLSVCPAVCYDLRFPELFRAGLAKGAQAFVIGACWLETRHAHWRALLIARAIENQAYVIGVNRTGRDPNANYLGGSMVVSPRGDVLGELDSGEGVLSVEVDPREVGRWREKFPAVRDRRLTE